MGGGAVTKAPPLPFRTLGRCPEPSLVCAILFADPSGPAVLVWKMVLRYCLHFRRFSPSMTLRWMCTSLLVATQLLSAQAQPGSDATSRLAGYTAESSPVQADWEKKFKGGIVPDNIRENMRRLTRASAPCRIALRQRQRRMDSGQIQRVGIRREDRNLQCVVPDSESSPG